MSSSRTCGRGLGAPLLVVSNGMLSIIKVIEIYFPGSER